MRILQIAGSGTAGTGDAGPISNVITQLCNSLDRAGHDVVLADAPAAMSRTEIDGGVQVLDELTPAPATQGGALSAIRSMVVARSRLPGIRALIDRLAPDVVHVHEPPTAALVGRQQDVPVLWTAHGLNWTMQPAPQRPGVRYRLGRRLESAAFARASHTVVLNEQTRAALGGRVVTTIPNGIDLARWPPVDRQCARRRLGCGREQFRVTFVGRVAPEKGVDVFMGAIDRLPRCIPLVADVVGSLAGVFGTSPAVTPYARKLVANGHRANFLGFQHRDTAEYRWRLAAADVVVVPSITEPFGLVVLEALACGARVVGSDVGGIRDVLGGGIGRLVPPGDPAALASALEDEYRHRTALDPGVVRKHLEKYTWDGIARSYLELMQTLVEAT